MDRFATIFAFVTDHPAGIMSFLGGGVFAWGLGTFWTHSIMRPVISVRLDKNKLGCYGPVPFYAFSETGQAKHVYDARALRLYVENNGRSSIKDCCGNIIHITKRTDKGNEVIPIKEIISLGWANHPQHVLSIPRGAFFHMDVITLHLKSTGSELTLPSLYAPTRLIDFFKDKGTYEFVILIVADNARPNEIKVKFDFDPLKDDLLLEDHQIRPSFPFWDVRSRLLSWWGN